MKQLRNIIDVWNMIEKFNLQGWVVKDSTVILLPVAEYERLLASVKNKNYPMRRKTPCFSYGDIRRVHRIYASN